MKCCNTIRGYNNGAGFGRAKISQNQNRKSRNWPLQKITSGIQCKKEKKIKCKRNILKRRTCVNIGLLFTRLLYQIRKMTILDCESIISVQHVSHLKFSSCGKISANGIGNLQRSNVFVKGNAREDQKWLQFVDRVRRNLLESKFWTSVAKDNSVYLMICQSWDIELKRSLLPLLRTRLRL